MNNAYSAAVGSKLTRLLDNILVDEVTDYEKVKVDLDELFLFFDCNQEREHLENLAAEDIDKIIEITKDNIQKFNEEWQEYAEKYAKFIHEHARMRHDTPSIFILESLCVLEEILNPLLIKIAMPNIGGLTQAIVDVESMRYLLNAFKEVVYGEKNNLH